MKIKQGNEVIEKESKKEFYLMGNLFAVVKDDNYFYDVVEYYTGLLVTKSGTIRDAEKELAEVIQKRKMDKETLTELINIQKEKSGIIN